MGSELRFIRFGHVDFLYRLLLSRECEWARNLE